MKKEEPTMTDESVGAKSKDMKPEPKIPPEVAARMYSGASFVGVGHTGTYTVPESVRDEYIE
jgi:hypothetical protein